MIHNNTIYNNNQYRYYPTIRGLNYLIDKLNSSTTNIRFNPFYVNSKIDRQIEFDDKSHLTKCMDHIYDIPHDIEQYDDMSEEKKRMAHILYPLCKKGDYVSFNQHLQDFKDCLDELIPVLFKEAIEKLHLSQEDMAFGYFCFEIHSG